MRSTLSNCSRSVNVFSLLAMMLLPVSIVIADEANVPFKYAVGKKKFQENCSSCHGKWLEGTNQGPPLLHGFYKPSHHGDPAFYRAAFKGVRAHHWNFGNMPKIEGITRKDMDQIVPFVRWYQQEKGLY